MAVVLKDKDGNLIVRPINHPATDEQVRTQLQKLITDGTLRLSDEQVQEIAELLEESGAISVTDEQVREQIQVLFETGVVSPAPSDSQVKGAVSDLIDEGTISPSQVVKTNAQKIADVVTVEQGYDTEESSTWHLIRIPRYDSDGNRVVPKVALTKTSDNYTTMRSAYMMAAANGYAVTINASLFNTGSKNSAHRGYPEGQLVIDGVDKSVYKTNTYDESDGDWTGNNYRSQTIAVDDTHSTAYSPNDGKQFSWMTSDMGTTITDKECYPLLIDENGKMSCIDGEDRTCDANQPANIIAAGYKYAVTGWGMLINNFADDTLYNDERVHTGKYVRQVIGQFENGDYLIFTCDANKGGEIPTSSTHEKGMSYAKIATLLINRGVKFAYSLDGGGSASTFIQERSVSPIYENYNSTTIRGRKIPVIIYFEQK